MVVDGTPVPANPSPSPEARARQILFTKDEYEVEHADPKAALPEDLVEYFGKKYGIRTDGVHRTCTNCQIRSCLKYGTAAKVRCGFIPKGISATRQQVEDLATQSDIPVERAAQLMKASVDPVAWAEVMFGFRDDDPDWHLRPHQKEIIRCSSLRQVIRAGRRSGKSFAVAIKLLHLAFTLKIRKGRDEKGKDVEVGPEIIIITPYLTQVHELFEAMEQLLKRNRDLRGEVTSGNKDSLFTQTPIHRMEFNNGCTIEGFVSGIGAKSDGTGGGTIRGASADVLYLDEMDMIPEDILDKAIEPLILTRPGVRLIASSTPIGKRGRFYRWCLESDNWKEDYYPSTVLAHWDDVKEELIRKGIGSEAFRTEYLAIFTEAGRGVFRHLYIQQARADYQYEDLLDQRRTYERLGSIDLNSMVKCVGIDWNETHGTEFYGVGFSPLTRKWYGLFAYNLAPNEFKGRRWKEEVVRLNWLWEPNYIYADKGYGHHLIEDLLVYGHELRAKRNRTPQEEQALFLPDRLKQFDFWANLELTDPVTNKPIKKHGKHFLVENAVRILEEDGFRFPTSDEILYRQMGNYIIERYQAGNNKPIYGMEDKKIGDHRLDAFMLAVGGISLEEGAYSGRHLAPSVPAFVARSERPKQPQGASGEEFLQQAQDRKVPAHFRILQIIRNHQPEADELAREPVGGRRSRDDFGSPAPRSLLEGLRIQPGNAPVVSTPHRIGPRRSPGHRGFGRR